MSLLGHVTRIGDVRKLRTMMFGAMERKNKRVRPYR